MLVFAVPRDDCDLELLLIGIIDFPFPPPSSTIWLRIGDVGASLVPFFTLLIVPVTLWAPTPLFVDVVVVDFVGLPYSEFMMNEVL